jgi:hypothetical protein
MEILISKEYVEKLKQLHQSNPSFGSKNNIPALLKKCLESHETKTVLDYGCGKGNVMNEVKTIYPNMQLQGYDPAVDVYSALPNQTFDLLYSTDVLEHVERDQIDATIINLAQLTDKIMYHLIACYPAKKFLPDGRNAHLIIEKPEYWRNKFKTILDWKLVDEKINDYSFQSKKGPIINVLTYEVILQK